jgi:hypothetical protein
MDAQGFEKVSEVASSVAERMAFELRVSGMPEQGPPYNGVSIRMGVNSLKDAGEKHKEVRAALGQAGLLYVESEGATPTNSPALKTWEVGASVLEFVDMSTAHGRFMDATYGTR